MEHFRADDGEHVHVHIQGQGPPIVLLHEWASNHRIWDLIAHRLADSFQVLRWDARGHGGHPRHVKTPLTVSRLAEDLGQLIRHYGLVRPIVVGHSMGALALWEFVRLRGCDDPGGMGLGGMGLGGMGIVDMTPKPVTDDAWHLGVFGDWPADANRRFVEAMGRDFVSAVLDFMARGWRRRDALATRPLGMPNVDRVRRLLAGLDPEPLIDVWDDLMAGDWRPVLPRSRVPTLLIFGQASNFYGVETAEFVGGAIPNATLHVYQDADHHPHLCNPARFTGDLARFAQQVVQT